MSQAITAYRNGSYTSPNFGMSATASPATEEIVVAPASGTYLAFLRAIVMSSGSGSESINVTLFKSLSGGGAQLVVGVDVVKTDGVSGNQVTVSDFGPLTLASGDGLFVRATSESVTHSVTCRVALIS